MSQTTINRAVSSAGAPLSAGRAAGSALAASAIALGLHHAGRYGLALPASLDPNALVEWSEALGPVAAAMAVLRLAAMAVSVYVAALGLLAVVASTWPSTRTLRVVRRATPRFLRRTLGIGALTALSLPAGIAASRTPPEPPPVMVQIDAPAPPSSSTTTTTPAGPGPAIVPPPVVQPSSADPSPPESRWVVRPGDHFWSIATATLEAHDTGATEADVARYWRALVEANRDRLVVPDNPDLVFAGQDLVLPPVDNLG